MNPNISRNLQSAQSTASILSNCLVQAQNLNALDTRHMTHEFAVGPPHSIDFSWEVRLQVRPSYPSGTMLLPFGRHALLGGSGKASGLITVAHGVSSPTFIVLSPRSLRIDPKAGREFV
jgi:hypothetical protein